MTEKMKRFLLIAVVSFITFSTALASEQVPDLLIIDKDTVFLKTFPLENLRVNGKVLRPSFDYGVLFVSTGCYRGYIATWQIIEGTLALVEVRIFDSSKKNFQGDKINIIEYLKNNSYNLKTINGFVIADWYSDTLKRYEAPFLRMDERFYLSNEDFSVRNFKRIELVFENGKLIENNIIPIEDYKIGDNLCFYSYAYYTQDRSVSSIDVNIHGAIRENNGKMVRLEILFISSDNDEIITQIKQGIFLENLWFSVDLYNNLFNTITNSILKLDDIEYDTLDCEGKCFFWINPRYFDDNCKYGNWIINVLNR